jgi:hypothetical protein
MKGIDLVSWLRREERKFSVYSIIWKNFMFSLHIIKRWLAWSIGSINRFVLGNDPFIVCNSSYNISGPLIQHLNNLNIYPLAQETLQVDSRINQSW